MRIRGSISEQDNTRELFSMGKWGSTKPAFDGACPCLYCDLVVRGLGLVLYNGVLSRFRGDRKVGLGVGVDMGKWMQGKGVKCR
jgi:hypothetical protein